MGYIITGVVIAIALFLLDRMCYKIAARQVEKEKNTDIMKN